MIKNKRKDVGRKIWFWIIIFLWGYFVLSLFSMIGVNIVRWNLGGSGFSVDLDILNATIFLLIVNTINSLFYWGKYKNE